MEQRNLVGHTCHLNHKVEESGICGKEVLPITATAGNYDFIRKQEKEKEKIYRKCIGPLSQSCVN